MAASTRPIDRLLRDQIRYLLALRGVPQSRIEEAVGALDAACAKAREPGPPEEIIVVSGAALPRSYVQAELAFDTRHEALAFPQPMLVVQGGRDYQVTAADDFENLRAALVARADVAFRLYPQLNHRFVAGEGPSTANEYLKPGHADGKVIADVAAWITTGHLPP